MTTQVLNSITTFAKQMHVGDEIRFVSQDGKIGFELATKIAEGKYNLEFIQTGEYGYFKSDHDDVIGKRK